MMNTKRKKDLLINIIFFAVILALAILFCRKLLSVLLPFLIAWLVALVLRPVVSWLNIKCRLKKGIASFLVAILFYAFIGFLMITIGARIIVFLKSILVSVPGYYNDTIEPILIRLTDSILDFSSRFNPAAASAVSDFLMGLGPKLEGFLSDVSMAALKSLTSVAISVPMALLHILITIIATVFIAMDYPVLKQFVLAQVSDRTHYLLHEIKIHLRKTIGRYIRSYALILLITFAEISVGLLAVRQDKPVLIAALIALFDILPVVGSGTILIPWAIIELLLQDYRMAIGLGVVYVVITVIRNIIEPKIVGDHVGMHPIVTLMSMVVGTYVFGGIGLFGLPITIALLKSLNDAGVIHIFQTVPDQTKHGDDGISEKQTEQPENGTRKGGE